MSGPPSKAGCGICSEFSPALYIVFHLQTEEKKDQSRCKLSQNYAFVQSVLNPLTSMTII
jgi:hypothetical protein